MFINVKYNFIGDKENIMCVSAEFEDIIWDLEDKIIQQALDNFPKLMEKKFGKGIEIIDHVITEMPLQEFIENSAKN